MSLLDRRINLITGKGGVGRTSVAVALARAAARTGRRVLLMEIGDPEGGYSAIGGRFGRETLGPYPEELSPGILGCHLWGATGHEEFLRSVLPGKAIIRAALRSRALSRFLTAAPSFHEMGLFYHLLTLIEATEPGGSPTHDLLIVDMPATGHTLALTGLTDILLRLAPSGPVAEGLKRGQSYINDPEKTAAWVVTLPQQLPVTEALELREGLEESQIPVGGMILNRFPDNPLTAEEKRALEEWMKHTPMHGEMALRKLDESVEAKSRLEGSARAPVFSLPDLHVPEDERDLVLGEAVIGHLESVR